MQGNFPEILRAQVVFGGRLILFDTVEILAEATVQYSIGKIGNEILEQEESSPAYFKKYESDVE